MGDWQKALEVLLSTNNFPGVYRPNLSRPLRGVLCSQHKCTDPVTIEYIEKEISDRGYKEGWIKPQPPQERTGKKVAVVGSGPAGLAAAQQLNRAGHSVTVLERADYIGGLLMLGIPDFKLDKDVVRRRVQTNGRRRNRVPDRRQRRRKLSRQVTCWQEYDAVCLTGGSTQARDLPVPGRDLDGIHLAMDYLPQQNKLLAGEES